MAARRSFRRWCAWPLVLGGLAVACGGDTTQGEAASLTGVTGGTAPFGGGGAETGGAATGGSEAGGAETGGSGTGGAAGADCTELSSTLQTAVSAFAPVTPNSCILDSDCVTVSGWAVFEQNHPGCWTVSPMILAGDWLDCPIVVASQWATELTAFLANDPAITAACDALRNAKCTPWGQTCLCLITEPGVCGSPTCVSGVCE